MDVDLIFDKSPTVFQYSKDDPVVEALFSEDLATSRTAAKELVHKNSENISIKFEPAILAALAVSFANPQLSLFERLEAWQEFNVLRQLASNNPIERDFALKVNGLCQQKMQNIINAEASDSIPFWCAKCFLSYPEGSLESSFLLGAINGIDRHFDEVCDGVGQNEKYERCPARLKEYVARRYLDELRIDFAELLGPENCEAIQIVKDGIKAQNSSINSRSLIAAFEWGMPEVLRDDMLAAAKEHPLCSAWTLLMTYSENEFSKELITNLKESSNRFGSLNQLKRKMFVTIALNFARQYGLRLEDGVAVAGTCEEVLSHYAAINGLVSELYSGNFNAALKRLPTIGQHREDLIKKLSGLEEQNGWCEVFISPLSTQELLSSILRAGAREYQTENGSDALRQKYLCATASVMIINEAYYFCGRGPGGLSVIAQVIDKAFREAKLPGLRLVKESLAEVTGSARIGKGAKLPATGRALVIPASGVIEELHKDVALYGELDSTFGFKIANLLIRSDVNPDHVARTVIELQKVCNTNSSLNLAHKLIEATAPVRRGAMVDLIVNDPTVLELGRQFKSDYRERLAKLMLESPSGIDRLKNIVERGLSAAHLRVCLAGAGDLLSYEQGVNLVSDNRFDGVQASQLGNICDRLDAGKISTEKAISELRGDRTHDDESDHLGSGSQPTTAPHHKKVDYTAERLAEMFSSYPEIEPTYTRACELLEDLQYRLRVLVSHGIEVLSIACNQIIELDNNPALRLIYTNGQLFSKYLEIIEKHPYEASRIVEELRSISMENPYRGLNLLLDRLVGRGS